MIEITDSNCQACPDYKASSVSRTLTRQASAARTASTYTQAAWPIASRSAQIIQLGNGMAI